MSTRARTSSANYFTGLAEWKAVNGHSHSAKSLPRDCTTYRMGEEEVSSSHYQETDHKNRNPPDRLVIRGGITGISTLSSVSITAETTRYIVHTPQVMYYQPSIFIPERSVLMLHERVETYPRDGLS